MSLVILRSEYLKLIQTHSKSIAELPKAVQFCAAKLIQYFQHWSNWKQNVHRTPWIYQPFRKIHADLMGEHSLHTIRAAIALLEQLGILKRRHNPSNGQDKTWQYQLNLDVLKQLLHSQCDSSTAETSAHAFSDHGTFKTEQGENNVEQHSQDQSIDIKPTTIDEKAEENVAVIEQPVEPASNITKLSTTPTIKPTKDELAEVRRQLRELRVNPDECARVIMRYWANVQGAIAYLKSATWANNPIAVFINACKKGLKPETQQQQRRYGVPEQIRPPNSSQLQALEDAKNFKKIHDWFFSGDGITKVVLNGGIQMMPWWDFLGVT